LFPLTQIQGERTDVVAQITFDSVGFWSAYCFVHHTVAAAAAVKAMIGIGLCGSIA